TRPTPRGIAPATARASTLTAIASRARPGRTSSASRERDAGRTKRERKDRAMSTPLRLVKGSPGKPLHPPLTDASIGAYTVGVAALIAGKAGLQTPQMAHAALIAISFGLLLAAPTAVTGLLDWLDIPKGTPARTTATIHLLIMVTTTVLFALTWLAQRPGYNHGEIRGL